MKPKIIEPKARLLTIRQAARFIEGLTEYRIRQLCASGDLPCLRVGKKYLINEQALLDFISQTTKTKGES